MTNQDAMFVLHGYRPSGRDAGDAAFGGALAQAQRDSTLGAWFARQQAFDGAVTAKLHEVTPPAGLREAILAGARMSASAAQEHKLVWWRQPAWLAMAAGVALLLAAGGGFWANRATASDEKELPDFATDYVAGGFWLRQHSANVDELKAWLARQKAPLPGELPSNFTKLRSLGCKTIAYRGKDISLICFGQGKEYHLFVARREDFPMLPANAVPQFFVRKGLATAAWSDAQHHYIVVTDDNLPALKECLNCTG